MTPSPDQSGRRRPLSAPAVPRRQRLRQLAQDYQWPIIISLLIASLLLGFIGFKEYAAAAGLRASPLDLLYLTLQLGVLESGAVTGAVSWELEIARWSLPILTAYTAVLAAAVVFRKQLQLARLWFIRDHVIVCGLGRKGVLLAHRLAERGFKIVVIERDPGNPHLGHCLDQGAIALEGDATDPALLRKAAVERARYLIAVCDEDGANAEIAVNAQELVAGRRRKALTCVIHLVDPQLCELLRERELGMETAAAFRLEMFNIYDRGARVLLGEHPAFADDANGSQSPHVLVVGLGQLGESLVVHMAREWYESRGEKGSPLSISVVDPAAGKKLRLLHSRYPKLSRCCELIPYPAHPEGSEFLEAGFLFDSGSVGGFCRIYVCLEDPTVGLQAALALRHQLDRDQPPIVVRMPEGAGLATLLKGPGSFRNVHPFGLLERTCTPDLVLGGTHEVIAQGLHAAYLRERQRSGAPLEAERALVPWDELPADLQESNRLQVDQIGLRLRSAGYGIKPLTDWEAVSFAFESHEVDLMAQQEHERWMAERQRQGWRFDPERKDSRLKSHPDLLPWDDLADLAREKNRQAVTALPVLLARAGFQVYRLHSE